MNKKRMCTLFISTLLYRDHKKVVIVLSDHGATVIDDSLKSCITSEAHIQNIVSFLQDVSKAHV